MSAKMTARNGAGSGDRSRSNGSAVPSGSKAHLQLVTDHGRLVNPGFVAGEAVWVTARVVRDEVGQRPGGRAEPRVRRDENAARGLAGQRQRTEAARRLGEGGPRPVRLTRRGRVAITSATVMLITAVVMVLASVA